MREHTPTRYAFAPPLAAGDRVRIVAPGGPFVRDRFDAGVDWLRDVGLEPVYDEALFTREGYLAGNDARRLGELQAAIADPDARAVWVARGGYGAMRLLHALAPERVAEHPRWLVGFSDVTALHVLWQRAGLGSLHAANVTTIDGWTAGARASLRALLFEGTPVALTGRTLAGAGGAEGPLVGGNLAMLASLAGTGWLPDAEGAVILIEDVREPPYRIDRMLTQLALAGAFEGAVGFAVGQLTDCDPAAGHEAGPSALEVIAERLGRTGAPVVAGLPVGHGPDAVPVALGAVARIDAVRGTLNVGDLGHGVTRG